MATLVTLTDTDGTDVLVNLDLVTLVRVTNLSDKPATLIEFAGGFGDVQVVQSLDAIRRAARGG